MATISTTGPVITRCPPETAPVGSAIPVSHDASLTTAKVRLGADALLSEVDSEIRDEPALEVSIEAQDQLGAL